MNHFQPIIKKRFTLQPHNNRTRIININLQTTNLWVHVVSDSVDVTAAHWSCSVASGFPCLHVVSWSQISNMTLNINVVWVCGLGPPSCDNNQVLRWGLTEINLFHIQLAKCKIYAHSVIYIHTTHDRHCGFKSTEHNQQITTDAWWDMI